MILQNISAVLQWFQPLLGRWAAGLKAFSFASDLVSIVPVWVPW